MPELSKDGGKNPVGDRSRGRLTKERRIELETKREHDTLLNNLCAELMNYDAVCFDDVIIPNEEKEEETPNRPFTDEEIDLIKQLEERSTDSQKEDEISTWYKRKKSRYRKLREIAGTSEDDIMERDKKNMWNTFEILSKEFRTSKSWAADEEEDANWAGMRNEVRRADKKRKKIANKTDEEKKQYRSKKRKRRRSILRKRRQVAKTKLRVHWCEILEEVKTIAARKTAKSFEVDSQEKVKRILTATHLDENIIDTIAGWEEDAAIEEALGEYSRRNSTLVRSSMKESEVWLCGHLATIDEAKMTIRIFACMNLNDEEQEQAQLKIAMNMIKKLENMEEQTLEQEFLVPLDKEHMLIYGNTEQAKRLTDFKTCMLNYYLKKGELKNKTWIDRTPGEPSNFFQGLKLARAEFDKTKLKQAVERVYHTSAMRKESGTETGMITAWLDSGAEINLFGKGSKSRIQELQKSNLVVLGPGGNKVTVDGVGTWQGMPAYYIDADIESLVSVDLVLERIADHGWSINFDSEYVSLMRFDTERKKILDEIHIGKKHLVKGLWSVPCDRLEEVMNLVERANRLHIYKVMHDIPIQDENKHEYYHRVFGHTDGLLNQVKRLQMLGMDVLKTIEAVKEFCGSCVRGKMSRATPDKEWLNKLIEKSNRKYKNRTAKVNNDEDENKESTTSEKKTDEMQLRLGEEVCLDISGPYKRSVDGYVWAVAAVDKGTRHQWRRTIKKKSHIRTVLQEIRRDIETMSKETKEELKPLRRDNRAVINKLIVDGDGVFRRLTKDRMKEMTTEAKTRLDASRKAAMKGFQELCEEEVGASRVKITGPYAHELNAHAEASIRRAQEQTRCMVIDSPLKSTFWSYAWRATESFCNLLSHSGLKKRMSSYQYRTGKIPDFRQHCKYLFPWGSTSAVHIAVEKRSSGKITETGRVGFYLGKSDRKGCVLAVVGKIVYHVPVTMIAVDGTPGGSIRAAVRERFVRNQMQQMESPLDETDKTKFLTKEQIVADQELKKQAAARVALEISIVLQEQIQEAKNRKLRKTTKEKEKQRSVEIENKSEEAHVTVEEMINRESLTEINKRVRAKPKSPRQRSEERQWQQGRKTIGQLAAVNFGKEQHIFVVVAADRQCFDKVTNSKREPFLKCIFPPQHSLHLYDSEINTYEEVNRCIKQFKNSYKNGDFESNQKTLQLADALKQAAIHGNYKEEEYTPFYNRGLNVKAAMMQAKVLTSKDISSKMDQLSIAVTADDIEQAVRLIDKDRRTHDDDLEAIFAEHKNVTKKMRVYFTEDQWQKLGKEATDDGLEFDEEKNKVYFNGEEVDYETIEPMGIESGGWKKVSTQKDAPWTRLRWLVAGRKEDRSFNRKSKYSIISRDAVPEDETILEFFRLVKHKEHELGHKRFKVRNCINGKGMEGTYETTWSPTVRNTSIRTGFKLCGFYGGIFASTDQSSAFLANDNPKKRDGTNQEYYCNFPAGFYAKDGRTYDRFSDKVMHLKSSCYGLRSAARQLFDLMSSKMIEQGYRQCEEDKAMFIKILPEEGRWCLVGCWVDDLGIWASDKGMVNELHEKMIGGRGKIEMSITWEPKRYCGYNITYYKDKDGQTTGFALDTNDYVDKLIAKWGVDRKGKKVKERDLPGDPNVSSKTLESEMEKMKASGKLREKDKEFARRMVGGVMYQAGKCDPMISPQVNRLATTAVAPTELWYKEFYHLIGFLKQRARKKPKLKYTKRKEGEPMVPELSGLSDASFNTTKIGRSLGGYLMFLDGEVIGYKTGLSSVVTLSTTESEAAICSLMVREMLWCQKLLLEIGLMIGPGRIGIDNIGALKNFVGQGGP